MKTIILFILLLLSLETFSQKKNKSSFNFGIASVNFYSKFFMHDKSGFPPEAQTAVTCFDFNFIYQIKIHNRLYILLGGGINQKGWTEVGGIFQPDCTLGDPPDKVYKGNIKQDYINMQTGLSYDFITFKKLTLNLGQLLTPEYGNNHTEYFRQLVLSSRTNLSLQYSISKEIGLQLTPFFETALSPYTKKNSNPKSSDWTPYGYGCTVGVLW